MQKHMSSTDPIPPISSESTSRHRDAHKTACVRGMGFSCYVLSMCNATFLCVWVIASIGMHKANLYQEVEIRTYHWRICSFLSIGLAVTLCSMYLLFYLLHILGGA